MVFPRIRPTGRILEMFRIWCSGFKLVVVVLNECEVEVRAPKGFKSVQKYVSKPKVSINAKFSRLRRASPLYFSNHYTSFWKPLRSLHILFWNHYNEFSNHCTNFWKPLRTQQILTRYFALWYQFYKMAFDRVYLSLIKHEEPNVSAIFVSRVL